MRRRVGALVAVTVALACAVSEPPSGGPEDRAQPGVVATTPTSDSTGVDPASPIAITFGEDMTRARVERLVSVQPPIIIERVRWEGRTLVIEPQGGLQRDTTYVVRLKPGFRDSHGVTSTQGREFAFATGAVLDTARISGRVTYKREPSSKAMVRLYRLPRGPEFRAEAARPDRDVATSQDGTYTLRHLPSNDARFALMAFVDVNGNGSFDKAEPFAVLPDTVVLTGAVGRVDDVSFSIIDPNEPGTVEGEVANETGIDTLLATVALFATRDSTRARYLTHVDSTGAFAFARVAPGGYRVWAFLDLRADSVRATYECPPAAEACPEPWATLPDSITVAPGASVKAGRLVLRRRE